MAARGEAARTIGGPVPQEGEGLTSRIQRWAGALLCWASTLAIAQPIELEPGIEWLPGRFPAGAQPDGNSVLIDSLHMARPDGRVCMAGFLGGGAPIAAFDPLMHMPSGVQLSFFASAFAFGTPDFPLSAIPFQAIVDRAARGTYKAKPVRVFRLDAIADAHRLMESGGANGKIVVRV